VLINQILVQQFNNNLTEHTSLDNNNLTEHMVISLDNNNLTEHISLDSNNHW
jgi:hypothetical protein